MAKDKKGHEIKPGDEIILRGRVVAVAVEFEREGTGILQVEWDAKDVPICDYVKSDKVEKL
jgi:hypothetical protein